MEIVQPSGMSSRRVRRAIQRLEDIGARAT